MPEIIMNLKSNPIEILPWERNEEKKSINEGRENRG